jgi:hypothetical protein
VENTMSIMEQLAQAGVSAEDIEKAASVRLFEEACAAEGIDLNECDDNEIEELYAGFVSDDDDDDEDPYEEATAKLAEAEVLGRHMARAYADEMDKLAEEQAPQ